MKNFRTIWQHEARQASRIVKVLLKDKKVKLNWRIILLPVLLNSIYRYRKDLRFTRKNILYTKKLAFEAAKNVDYGKDQAWEFRRIEIRTQEILNKEKKGFYTEKIRRKQLSEIELLIKHYLNLFGSAKSTYADIIRDKYPSKGDYLAFLTTLHQAEEDVIQAAVTTMRKGTKKNRREWFQKVKDATKKMRLVEADKIYS